MNKINETLLILALTLSQSSSYSQVNTGSVVIDSSSQAHQLMIKGRETDVARAIKAILGTLCADTARVYFKVGNQTFVAQSNEIEQEATKLKQLSYKVNKETNAIEYIVPKSTGCSENPVLLVSTKLARTLKGDRSRLVISEELEPNNASRYILNLINTKQCDSSKFPQVALCAGSKTVDGVSVTVLFLIPLNESGGISVGGAFNYPVHARCEGTESQNLACTVDEYFGSQFKASIVIRREDLSKETILRTREQLIQSVNSLTVSIAK